MSIVHRQLLHHGWKFRQLKGKDDKWLSARVPGCVHADLLHHKRIPDPFWGDNELQLAWMEEAGWTYRCEFTVGSGLRSREHIDLVVEGLDTLAILRLNSREIAKTESMFFGFRVDVASSLKPGRNLLEITFLNPMSYIRARKSPTDFAEWNDPVGGASHIRKEQCSFGWDWGPRFPTAGIYLPIQLEAWDENRIESVRVTQSHRPGQVILNLAPATTTGTGQFRHTVSLAGKVVSSGPGLQAEISAPQLWWPNGHGDQPLYDVRLELIVGDSVVDTWEKRIGLRTIVLDRHPDAFGETFQFVVNGKAIFAKGANWIPAHSFVTEAGRALYDDLLTSAAEAHMNMIRVWGGGIYEKEEFYDLCDEKGLLVWQDFMFACAQYPGTPEFQSLVRQEAEYQVKRLSWRTSLALWCGNNEIEQMVPEIVKTPDRKAAYEELFYDILPSLVEKLDGATPYWPSSPHNPEGYEKGHNNECAGDCHFWDVWHGRFPVKRYEEMNFRFCSEFGMQSYCSPEVAATFCRPENFNVFGPEMENHQKNNAGNQIILDYISRLYRFPKDYAALAYLSQLNQAYCMKIGVEHFRRSSPRTMGALYWQLNDCWPVASWSSLEFGGRWKALHYEAKRFFAPALLSIHVPGTETAGKGNIVTSTIHDVHIHTVFDGPQDQAGVIVWSLHHLRQGVLRTGKRKVALRYGESARQLTLDFASDLKRHGARSLILQAELVVNGEAVSRQTVFFTAPRYLDLPPARIEIRLKKIAPSRYNLTLTAKTFQHAVGFHFRGIAYRASDNFFDLFPQSPREIVVTTEKDLTVAALRKSLETTSLRSSYR
ncbi:MAG TPA: glycoside hydrolase family 2 protein [Candidatus Methylacidiphilales bacterium]